MKSYGSCHAGGPASGRGVPVPTVARPLGNGRPQQTYRIPVVASPPARVPQVKRPRPRSQATVRIVHPPEIVNQVVALYLEGQTIPAIAKSLHLSKGRIRRILIQRDIEFRDDRSRAIPPTVAREDVTVEAVAELWLQGLSKMEIGRRLGTSDRTVRNRIAQWKKGEAA